VSDAARFAWVEDGERLSAACFTAVVGVEADEAVTRLGGLLETERRATFAEAFNPYPDAQYVVFDEVAPGVLLAENNGWEGSRPELAQALSRGGRLAGVYWSVNADMSFVYAVDGVLLTRFDPLLVEQPWAGAEPRALDGLVADLPFGADAPRAASFALLERLTGMSVGLEWLDAAHRCAEVRPLPELSRD
jgi:uncharacterized protein DUF6461